MKKLIIVLLVLIFTLSVCFSACADTQDPNNNQSSNNNQNSENNQGSNNNQGSSEASDTSGYKLTEQQWKDAFDFAASLGNKTYTVAEKERNSGGELEEITAYLEIEDAYSLGGYEEYRTKDKIKISGEYHSLESDNKWYSYLMEGGVWIKRFDGVITGQQNPEWPEVKEYLYVPIEILQDKYNWFTYNEERNQYEANYINDEDEDFVLRDCVVRFKDGKLEYTHYLMSDSYGTSETTCTFSKYGTTKITLPTDYIEYED